MVEPSLRDESEFLYAAQPELLRHQAPQLTAEQAMHWYRSRAEEIEHCARQVGTRGRPLPAVPGVPCLGWLPGARDSLRAMTDDFVLLLFTYALSAKFCGFFIY